MARPCRFEVRNGLEWVYNKLVRADERYDVSPAGNDNGPGAFGINFRSPTHSADAYRHAELLIGKR